MWRRYVSGFVLALLVTGCSRSSRLTGGGITTASGALLVGVTALGDGRSDGELGADEVVTVGLGIPLIVTGIVLLVVGGLSSDDPDPAPATAPLPPDP